MFDEGAQQRFVVADGEGGYLNLCDEVREFAGRKVRQEIVPDPHHRHAQDTAQLPEESKDGGTIEIAVG